MSIFRGVTKEKKICNSVSLYQFKRIRTTVLTLFYHPLPSSFTPTSQTLRNQETPGLYIQKALETHSSGRWIYLTAPRVSLIQGFRVAHHQQFPEHSSSADWECTVDRLCWGTQLPRAVPLSLSYSGAFPTYPEDSVIFEVINSGLIPSLIYVSWTLKYFNGRISPDI